MQPVGRISLLERIIMKAGFECIHDGANSPEQANIPPSEVACFYRKYRWKIDGEFVSTWIKIKHDYRSDKNNLVEFEIHCKDPDEKFRNKMLLSEDSELAEEVVKYG